MKNFLNMSSMKYGNGVLESEEFVSKSLRNSLIRNNFLEFLDRLLRGVFRIRSIRNTCFMKSLPSAKYVQLIMHEGLKKKQFLVLRFGLYEYLLCYQFLEKVNGLRETYSPFIRYHIAFDAGIFSENDLELDEYARYIILNMDSADVIAYWRNYPNRNVFKRFYGTNVKHINVDDLYPFPFFHKNENPIWHHVLRNRKVLIVSSFSDTIRKQYANRKKIWKNADKILPEFHLIAYQSVCTQGGFEDKRFRSWSEAVCFMKKEILEIDFDIAFISCGGYGLPLAIALKKEGKRVVQWGGCYQLWFGIKGNRWIGNGEVQKYVNKSWVYPRMEETPPLANKVDNYAYWKSRIK